MSVESDSELLFLEAIETYRKKYGTPRVEVTEIFIANEVFEKLVEQHEYLHQVSFEEAFEFVEDVIREADA